MANDVIINAFWP